MTKTVEAFASTVFFVVLPQGINPFTDYFAVVLERNLPLGRVFPFAGEVEDLSVIVGEDGLAIGRLSKKLVFHLKKY
jgi:hypothetical protein